MKCWNAVNYYDKISKIYKNIIFKQKHGSVLVKSLNFNLCTFTSAMIVKFRPFKQNPLVLLHII